jgi:spore coat polysaccharide biosynthesis protein SpsF
MVSAVIVQARATSTRLPGKVLADLAGAPLLTRVLERLRLVRGADVVCVATTVNATDDAVAELARAQGAEVFRGSEDDVLSRYVGAAQALGADLVCRVTSDCPLIDAPAVDAVIDALAERRATHDYASNRLVRRLPRGLDAEAIWTDALLRTDRLATSRPAREHVTWLCYRERPDLFALHAVVPEGEDASDLRWTVDTPDDLAMVRRLYHDLELAGAPDRPYREILAHVRHHPEIAAMNTHVEQKDA